MKSIFSWLGKIFSAFSRQTQNFKKIQEKHHWDKSLVHSLNKARLPSFKQLKYLGRILSRREKTQIQAVSGVIIICLILLLGQIYAKVTAPAPKSGGEYTEALVGSPRLINPILAQTNDVDLDLSQLIFSGLLKYDKERHLVPDLSESYEISQDQLVYTFVLKKNIKWHDGAGFKADDVIFTVASIQDPEFNSPLSRSFRGVAAEKVDDYKVKFTLKEPFAPFLGLLTFGILPEHLWYNVPPANADSTELNKKPVGAGAWKFSSLKKDYNGIIRSYSLIPNPDYYGPKPYLKKIIFKFYGDFISAVDGLKSKEVQGLAYLPNEYREELKKYKNLEYHNLEQPQYTAVFFNQKKNELLGADYVRQSLALATDKKRIISEIFNNENQAIDGPALPGIETNPDIKKYDFNPAGAAALLEKNGWRLVSTTTPDGLTEQIRKKKDWYLTIALTTVNQPKNIEIAELVKKMWDQIGVKTTLNIVEKEKIVKEVINARNYEALLFAENLGSDPDPFPFWHSSQSEYPGLNLAVFSDKKVDKLLENARQTNNFDERKKYYAEFQKIISEALPAIFLFNPIYAYPQDKAIKGFDLSGIAVPSDRFINLSEWYLKTKRVWK